MRHRHTTLVLTVVAALATGGVLTGCGSSGSGGTSAGTGSAPATGGTPQPAETNPVGDIPDSTAYVAFQPQPGKYEIKVPEGWARSVDGNAFIFTDKLNSVRLETLPAATAPTVDTARATEVPPIQAAGRRFSLRNVSTVQRKAGNAVLISYKADSPVDPVTNKVVPDAVERYEFWHAGTEAVVTLSGPVNADNVDPWRIVTDSFRWLG
jgi:hypothetical protein